MEHYGVRIEKCHPKGSDKELISRIIGLLDGFIGDRICIQGIDKNNLGYLFEGKLERLHEPVSEKLKLRDLGISTDIEFFGEQIFKFGCRKNQDRIGRIVIHNHPCSDETNRVCFDNVKVLYEWYNLFDKGQTNVGQSAYDYFAKTYGISDRNWMSWHAQKRFERESSSRKQIYA